MPKSELRKDLEKLAKLVYDLGKKHGDIYISASHCKYSEHASVDYGNGVVKSVSYWGKRTGTKKYENW